MDKLVEEIVQDIRDAKVPDDMTWEERVGFMVAKNNLANMLVTKYANL
jgi:hypothetical protein